MGEENRDSSGSTAMIVIVVLGGLLLFACCGGVVVVGGFFMVGTVARDAQMETMEAIQIQDQARLAAEEARLEAQNAAEAATKTPVGTAPEVPEASVAPSDSASGAEAENK